jgi:hypothetical protein
MANSDLSDEQYRALYAWIDAIPLSRPKRNIARDFSDGCLVAEVIAAYFPHLVEIHNYPPANSLKQKIYNWETLNTRVLKKLGFTITRPQIEDVVNCKPGSVEQVLNTLQYKMAKYRERKSNNELSPGPGSVNKNDNMNDYGSQAGDQERGRAGGGGRAGNVSNNAQNIGGKNPSVKAAIDQDILLEKEHQIRELQETVEILELKIAKLEQLVRLKDNKIQKLMGKS